MVLHGDGSLHYVYDTAKKRSHWHVPHIATLADLDVIDSEDAPPPSRHGALDALCGLRVCV